MPTVAELRRGIAGRVWTDFYLLAGQLLREGEAEEAGMWLYVGQMRGRAYIRCLKPPEDGDPALLASLNEVVGAPVNQRLYQSIRGAVAAIDGATAWAAAHPDPALPSPKCDEAVAFVRDDKAQQRAYTLANAAEIRAGRAERGLPNDPD